MARVRAKMGVVGLTAVVGVALGLGGVLEGCSGGAGPVRRSTRRTPAATTSGREDADVVTGPKAIRPEQAERAERVAGAQRAAAEADPGAAGAAPMSAKIMKMTAAERASLRERALTLLANTAAGGSPEERANALEALVPTPARLAAAAEPALRDDNVGVRSVAALAIGKAKAASVAPKVKPLLQDTSPFARASAIFALKRCGVPVDPTPLAGMLADPSPRVRAHAAWILGELGEASALGPLSEAQKDAPPRANPSEVRVLDLQIAEARVKLGDPAGLADVRAALFPARAEDLEAAVLATQICGQLHDTQATNRLIDLAGEKDPSGQPLPGELRMGAAMALHQLGQKQGLGSSIAREYFAGGQEALRAMAAHLMGATQQPGNLQILARMMEDPDGRVRVAAASAIVKTTGESSRE
jgi:HEAT repeat protein